MIFGKCSQYVKMKKTKGQNGKLNKIPVFLKVKTIPMGELK